MTKYLTAILAGLAALAAWFLRGFLANRKEQKLTQQRDTALITGKQQQINAQAHRQQAAIQQKQQQKEDAINAGDTNSISAELDGMFDN